MSPPPVLRMNVLKRRAAILQTDVARVVAHDAATESPSGDGYTEDAERADKNRSAVPERKVP
jgi:hypothetical protein